MYVFFPYTFYGIDRIRYDLASVYFWLFRRHMEEEILLVATHYIEKDRDLRKKSKVARSGESARRRLVSGGGGCNENQPLYTGRYLGPFYLYSSLSPQS